MSYFLEIIYFGDDFIKRCVRAGDPKRIFSVVENLSKKIWNWYTLPIGEVMSFDMILSD